MELYDLRIQIEELEDGGDYRFMGTSPDLPNLIVVADTAEEVVSQAPRVASALITSMRASGDALPPGLRPLPNLPFESHVTVAVPA